MTTATRSVIIAAPVEQVFDTVAHIDRFSEAVPAIREVEFLSETRRGVGARFKETREMNGREGSTVLEVTEYEENERVRIVSDAGGAIWDTLFTTRPTNDGTELAMAMEAKPHTLLARISTPMIKGMVTKAIQADLDAVKEYCET
ncbi:MAG: SRPBCC family protein [Acidimicrobiia bacterium]